MNRTPTMGQMATTALALLLTLPMARADEFVWNGTGSDWFDAANWGDGTSGIPGDGDTALIGTGAVTLTNATARLAAFAITNATLTFSDTTNLTTSLQAVEIAIRNLGVVTHVTNSDTLAPWLPDARVHIACSNLAIDAGGKIDATAKGYRGVYQAKGYGPQPGTVDLYRPGGAGHGGRGGQGERGIAGGTTCDSLAAPKDAGSGGGGCTTAKGTGGSGGGIVHIAADGEVTVNGSILAEGQQTGWVDYGGGGGAGGSVHIQCNTFTGTASGLISAKGGHGKELLRHGGGGGGRIAINYDPAAQAGVTPTPAVRFRLEPGNGAPADADTVAADPGSLWLADERFFGPPDEITQDIQLYINGFTHWAPDALTVTGVVVALLNGGLTLAPTNSLTVGNRGELRLSSPTVSAGQSILVQDSSVLRVSSAATNGTEMSYGASLNAAESIHVSGNSTVYLSSHGTDGGSVLLTARTAAIDAGSSLNANLLGFSAGVSTHLSGYGPGGGPYHQGYRGGGAGHGGKGGRSAVNVSAGVANDSLLAPTLPGSGAASGGGAGGGTIWLRTSEAVTVNGTLTANGSSSGMGGAAGGSIFIDCRSLDGSGALRADGGSSTDSSLRTGGGGGGRIAVWTRVTPAARERILRNDTRGVILLEALETFSGTTSVTNGAGHNSGIPEEYSQPGTVVFLTLPPSGTVLAIR